LPRVRRVALAGLDYDAAHASGRRTLRMFSRCGRQRFDAGRGIADAAGTHGM